MRHGRALLPAFAVTTLLLSVGCSSTTPHAERPSTGHGHEIRVTGAPDGGRDHSLTVAAAPAANSTAAVTAGPRGSGRRAAQRTTLTVSSYDSRTRRAVISGVSGVSGVPAGKPASRPTSTPAPPASSPPTPPASSPTSPSTPPAARHEAAVGDVIASAPAPGAPHGLLARVTKVIGHTDRGTEVQTEPAALNSVLGDETAKGTVPVAPDAFAVDKLLPGVKVSWSKPGDVHIGPKGATVPLGSLRLDVGAKVPTAPGAPASASASVSGFVQVAPRVDFTYGGTGTEAAPGSAYLGVSGRWSSGWSVRGRAAAAGGTPVRIPFAKLHADPVLQVGPVPVVVNLDLTCYVQVSGDGHVTVDVAQTVKGGFKAGGTFGPAKGWAPVSSTDMTSTPVRASLTTVGRLRTTLGAEASVGLYGTVGVTTDLAPYLRGEASATVTTGTGTGTGSGTSAASGAASSSGAHGTKARGGWQVYGGVDLSGTLRVQLSVFGTPVLRRSVPLGSLHREWKLADGSLP
ncbi:hypothetical protein OIB37_27120 [Streptomyces sp. NBC_00820]|uniref:hypothetical protein n=1 Tax=Streptomyces sp. NBC_00820 TaxID=2975842 RepID=UPI002ED36070|nr:hypothetical protein OIB37_27120 [Streptomyces sp. NBC_00820]